MNSLSAGWTVDTGDPSVGIFGTEVVHDDCPAWDEEQSVVGDDKWETVGLKFVPREGYTEVVTTRQATCASCGQSVLIYDYDVTSVDEEEASNG